MSPGPGAIARQANILGAFALVVADQTAARTAEASGQSISAAAALSALRQFLDQPTLDQLRSVLGLTPSGAVRLVDRLAAAGLVTRGPGADGRTRSVSLTAKGRRTADRIGAARAEALSGLLDDLTAAERTTLEGLVTQMMTRVVTDKDGGAWICRLCDLNACQRDAGRCPTANATAAKYDQQAERERSPSG